MDEELATGSWCRGCEFFETDVEDNDEGQCMACGCSINSHIGAKVIAFYSDGVVTYDGT